MIRAGSTETKKLLGALTRGVTTTHGETMSGVVSGRVTLIRPGDDGNGVGASRTTAAAAATDISMHGLNDTANHAILRGIEKHPRQIDGRDRAPRRHDSDDRRGADKKWAEDGSTSAEDKPFDPWLEAKRRPAPADKPLPQRDPWEGYCRKPGARDSVWEGWQHFDYADESDFEGRRLRMASGGGNRPTERLSVPTFNGEDGGDDVGTTARSYLRQVEAWRRMTRLPAAQQGLVLYQNLAGKAWVAAEELSVDKLSADNGVQYLVKWISGRYLDLEITRIGKAFSEFFRRLRRRPGQSIREYTLSTIASTPGFERLVAPFRKIVLLGFTWTASSSRRAPSSTYWQALATPTRYISCRKLQ